MNGLVCLPPWFSLADSGKHLGNRFARPTGPPVQRVTEGFCAGGYCRASAEPLAWVACGRREPISWSGGAWQEHRCHVMGARHPPLQSLVAHHASRRQATTQGAKPHTAGPAVCGEGQGGRRRPYHHWGGIRWARLAWRLPHLPISFLYGSAAIRQLRRWVLVTGGRRRDRKREGERERERGT